MNGRTVCFLLVLAAAGPPVAAQEIPDRPEKLVFPDFVFETPDGSLQLFVHQESLPPSMTAKHLMPGADPPPFRASYPATGGSTALSLEWPVRPGALPWSWSMMAFTPR